MKENLILTAVKDAYMKFFKEEKHIPELDDNFYDVKKYIDNKELVDRFEKMTLKELRPYILFLAQAYEKEETPSTDECTCLKFAETIVGIEGFIDELIDVHFIQLYYHLDCSTELDGFDLYYDDELDVETQQKIIAEIQKLGNKKEWT